MGANTYAATFVTHSSPYFSVATSTTVQILEMFCNGLVLRVESDEHAVIKNVGGSPANLAGWRLNASDPGQDFQFPDFVLQPGQECRTYSNDHHLDSCGFTFGTGKAIWNNKGNADTCMM